MPFHNTGEELFHSDSNLDMQLSGYRLRCQISKALQWQSDAIKKALERYNTQAAHLDPPQPFLSWSDIVEYSFIGEFNLLRHSQDNIHSVLWAQPALCEATLKYFQLCQAWEELMWLNVEICRLCTWIRNEDKHMTLTSVISHL